LTQEVEHLRTGKRWGRAAAVHPSYSEFYQASAYAGFQHEIRPAGSLGVQLMYVRQDGHELTDCATPDLLIGIRKRITASPARYDLGDGWIDIPSDRPHTVAAPPLTDIGYRIEGPSELIIVAAPAHRLAGALDSPALIERLAPVYEKPFADPLFDVLGTRAWIEAERDDGLFVDSAVVAMLSLMLSASDTIRKTSPGVAPPADLRFNRVIDYIDAHLAEDMSLTDLSLHPGLQGPPWRQPGPVRSTPAGGAGHAPAVEAGSEAHRDCASVRLRRPGPLYNCVSSRDGVRPRSVANRTAPLTIPARRQGQSPASEPQAATRPASTTARPSASAGVQHASTSATPDDSPALCVFAAPAEVGSGRPHAESIPRSAAGPAFSR
jgi:AraC family transcriptional regulator